MSVRPSELNARAVIPFDNGRVHTGCCGDCERVEISQRVKVGSLFPCFPTARNLPSGESASVPTLFVSGLKVISNVRLAMSQRATTPSERCTARRLVAPEARETAYEAFVASGFGCEKRCNSSPVAGSRSRTEFWQHAATKLWAGELARIHTGSSPVEMVFKLSPRQRP